MSSPLHHPYTIPTPSLHHPLHHHLAAHRVVEPRADRKVGVAARDLEHARRERLRGRVADERDALRVREARLARDLGSCDVM